jgi:hypothetical protein
MVEHVRTVVPEVDRAGAEATGAGQGRAGPGGRAGPDRAAVIPGRARGKQIAAIVGCAEPTVITWRRRYAESGLVGLGEPAAAGRIVTTAREAAGSGAAADLHRTADPVRRDALALPAAGHGAGGGGDADLARHRRPDLATLRRPALASGDVQVLTDPQLEGKIRDVLGCYCIRRRRRSCSAWTRSRRSRRWNEAPRPFPSDPDARGGQLRLRPARRHRALRRPRGRHRPGHRRLHRASPPPGVCGLPPAGRRRLSPPRATGAPSPASSSALNASAPSPPHSSSRQCSEERGENLSEGSTPRLRGSCRGLLFLRRRYSSILVSQLARLDMSL